MSTTSNPNTARRRTCNSSSWKRTAMASIALMAAYNVTPADCFGTVATAGTLKSEKSSIKRYFTVDENMGKTSTASIYSSSPASPVIRINKPNYSNYHQEDKQRLPTWLRIEKAHLLQDNMKQLHRAMLESSFFTETEVLKLNYAIQESARGDPHKMAGAAEFCLIMVETMEMGLNALIAAAFHYCHCVAAREKSLLSDTGSLQPWEISSTDAGIMNSFGVHASQIERDSAKLKRLEMVASSVESSHRVTPDANGAGNLRNLFLTEAKDWRALAIRGAACLYRLRGILNSNTNGGVTQVTPESGRVCREALRIYAPIASRLGMHRLKNELEDAAFRILYRRQYETVTSLLHQTRHSQNFYLARREPYPHSNVEPDIGESMEQILAQVQEEMTHLLKNDPEFSSSVKDFTVTARVKESYSTWKKMLRNHFDHILQVPDALALRVVLNAEKKSQFEPDEVTRARDRALCYYAQKLCMERWKPHKDEPRFKDYIASPKANGYQSLHYTASTEWHGEEWNMEVQVRSGEMHKVAEFGVASHWDYKIRGKNSKVTDSSASEQAFQVTINEHFGRALPQTNSDAYLRSLQEWQWKQQRQQSSLLELESDVNTSSVTDPTTNAEGKARMERIRARTLRLAPYIEALTTAQSNLARENVFVFLHSSKDPASVVALPAGAVVLDALRVCDLPYVVENVITHNGAPTSLTTRLQNGDVLSIPSATACVTSI